MSLDLVLDAALFAFLIVMAIGMIREKNLFAAVMLSGIFSLLSAGLYVVMDAVDVAFTEAAVGAGISTVLMVAALALTKTEEKESEGQPLLAAMVCFMTGLVLVYATLDMPTIGDPNGPIHHHMAPEFLMPSYEQMGVQNFVTTVLASFRGYDTMGETTVVLAAAVGVLLLLRSDRPEPVDGRDEARPSLSDGRDEARPSLSDGRDEARPSLSGDA